MDVVTGELWETEDTRATEIQTAVRYEGEEYQKTLVLRKRNRIYPLYSESKKRWYQRAYLQNRNRLTENELTVVEGRVGGRDS